MQTTCLYTYVKAGEASKVNKDLNDNQNPEIKIFDNFSRQIREGPNCLQGQKEQWSGKKLIE